MPKNSLLVIETPPRVRALLRELGTNLGIACKRRKESLRVWAARMGVSQPTLVCMEQVDPGVAMGTYATALWMMGRAQALSELAAPQLDLGTLENEVRAAQVLAVRAPISLQAPEGFGPHGNHCSAGFCGRNDRPSKTVAPHLKPTAHAVPYQPVDTL